MLPTNRCHSTGSVCRSRHAAALIRAAAKPRLSGGTAHGFSRQENPRPDALTLIAPQHHQVTARTKHLADLGSGSPDGFMLQTHSP